MVVSGTVTKKMAPSVKKIYDRCRATLVIAMGACASTGGMYRSYSSSREWTRSSPWTSTSAAAPAPRGPDRGGPRDPAEDRPRRTESGLGAGGRDRPERVIPGFRRNSPKLLARSPRARSASGARFRSRASWTWRSTTRSRLLTRGARAASAGRGFLHRRRRRRFSRGVRGRASSRRWTRSSGAPGSSRRSKFGSGGGRSPADVLDAAQRKRRLPSRLRYVMADRSPACGKPPRACPGGGRLRLRRRPGASRRMRPGGRAFDALPVHRLRRRGGRLLEVLVDLSPTSASIENRGTPEREAEERRGATAPPPGRGEANRVPGRGPQLDLLGAAVPGASCSSWTTATGAGSVRPDGREANAVAYTATRRNETSVLRVRGAGPDRAP